MTWLRDNLRLAIGIAIAAVVIVGLALFGWNQWQATKGAKTQATMSKNQTGAAIQSGADAVGTISNRMQADQAGDNVVQETKDAINNATDADGVDRAGRDGLCRLPGYSKRVECMR